MPATSDETSLSLAWFEYFGSAILTLTTPVSPSRQILARQAALDVLEQLVLRRVVVDRARQRLAEAGEVRAAVAVLDRVGEAGDVLGVPVVPLHRDLDLDAFLRCP